MICLLDLLEKERELVYRIDYEKKNYRKFNDNEVSEEYYEKKDRYIFSLTLELMEIRKNIKFYINKVLSFDFDAWEGDVMSD